MAVCVVCNSPKKFIVMSVYLRYNVQWVSIYIHIYTFVIMREIDLQSEAQP